MKYSVIISSYYRPELLDVALNSIAKLDFETKLVIDDGSSEENFLKILKICNHYKVDLIRKDRQRGVANTWNLGMIYTPTRYVVLMTDDSYFREGVSPFEYFDEAFEKGFRRAALMRSDVVGMDKKVVTEVGWYDERFPVSHCEDSDYVIRMNEYYGKNMVYPTPPGKKMFENRYCVHDRGGFDRFWVHDHYCFTKQFGSNPNEKFFLEKWEIDRERLEKLFPGITKGEETDKNDYELIAIAAETFSVRRKKADIDFYPFMTERYLKGNYSAYEKLLKSIAAYYKLRRF